MEKVVFLDLETTGIASTDEIIEIGAVKVLPGGHTETYQRLIKPVIAEIPPHIIKLCRGISEKDIYSAYTFDRVKEEFLAFIGDYPIVCHNAEFEKRMLRNALGKELENVFLDTLVLFLILKPELPEHNMEYLVTEYLCESEAAEHRALSDATQLKLLTEKLLTEIAPSNPENLENTLEMLEDSGWEWIPYLREIPRFSPNPFDKNVNTSPKGWPDCSFSLSSIKALLQNENRWKSQFPQYRRRPQQQDMALYVAEAFRKNHALFVEAPTGSGKTLAYLLTALLWVAEENEQVFISTNTKGLQQQLQNELPGVAKVLEMSGLRFADMKGISNYICRRKVEEGASRELSGINERLVWTYLLNWSRSNASGEINDVSYWMHNIREDFNRLVSALCCYTEECEGESCKFASKCFYRKSLKDMENCHICTINHSLLLNWPAQYPHIKRLIIDEAHVLEEKAIQSFSSEVNLSELHHSLGGLIQDKHKGFLRYLYYYANNLGIDTAKEDIQEAEGHSETVKSCADQVTAILGSHISENEEYNRRSGLPFTDKGFNQKLEEHVISMSEALYSLANSLNNAASRLIAADEKFKEKFLCFQSEIYENKFNSWAKILERCFQHESLENNCPYIEYNQKWWAFRIAPLDVAEPFYNKVASKCSSVVLTSATLAEEGSYERPSRTLGFYKAPEKLTFKGPLENVYDYKNSSVLALPNDSPPYDTSEFVDYAAKAVVEAAKMLNGRTMVLFNNLNRLEKVKERASPNLEIMGISVLGGKYRSKLKELETFKKDENAVIFGSRGFFEGIDVKGPALSCIIIEKLSFKSPNDPLHQARRFYVENIRKSNAFYELDVPEAAKVLRQQFGRLLRSEHDKGMVIVLDQLGQNKNYCQSIISELPGPEVIKDMPLEEIIENMEIVYKNWGLI